MTKVGIGYRTELESWINSGPPEIECLEVTAEHFAEPKRRHRLRALAQKYPLMLHSLSLSLGTPGPLDQAALHRLADIAADADPRWISDHIGFCRTGEVNLGHFNPVPPEPDTVRFMADHAREVMETCGRPIILENITANLQINGSLSETEFLNRLSEESGCGLLLDVTNLFVNCSNRSIDPISWLRDIDADRIVQLHIVGYTHADGRWHDFHEEAIQDALWQLMCEVLSYASPQAVTIERDGHFPAIDELESELRQMRLAVRQGAKSGGEANDARGQLHFRPAQTSPGAKAGTVVIASHQGQPPKSQVCISDNVGLFILEDQGVFFSAATQELLLFNPPATYVWCCLEEGLLPNQIIIRYAVAFGTTEEESSREVIGLLHRWQGMGYIDGIGVAPPAKIDFTTALGRLLANRVLRAAFTASPEMTAKKLAIRDQDRAALVALDPHELELQAQMLAKKKEKFRHRNPEAGNAANASFIRRLQTHAWEAPPRAHYYRLLDTLLCLRFSTAAQEAWVHSVLAPLEVEATDAADVTLDVVEERCGHVIIMDGNPVGLCARGDQLAREVLIVVRDTTINRAVFFLQIHAGVVSEGTHGLLLPAAPGGGKSTLTAALVKRGFRYLTDEIALLESETLHVRPVPFAITVKPGSLEPLGADYPQLADAPRHRREDEQDVVYLIPAAQDRCPADSDPVPVRWIVFPRYGADENTTLRPLGKAEALSRLLSECLVVPRDLDHASVAALIAWIRQTECYELPFSSLAEAGELLGNLCLEGGVAG